MATAALAAPAANADVTVTVGDATLTFPVRNCEQGSAEGLGQTVSLGEIGPITVGPLLPDLGSISVTVGDGEANTVPIGGSLVTVDVPAINLDRVTVSTPDGAEGPEASPFNPDGVGLPATLDVFGVETPGGVSVSSCARPASGDDDADPPTPEGQDTPEADPPADPPALSEPSRGTPPQQAPEPAPEPEPESGQQAPPASGTPQGQPSPTTQPTEPKKAKPKKKCKKKKGSRKRRKRPNCRRPR